MLGESTRMIADEIKLVLAFEGKELEFLLWKHKKRKERNVKIN